MHLEALRAEVCSANIALQSAGLITLTWGNVSGIDRESGHVAIKPSGVAYEDLTPDKIVIVDLDGFLVDGDLKPSSDTPTHIRLYRAFESARGISHTHSRHAVMFAQAAKAIPCLGTTHADHFYGEVPVTRMLTQDEVKSDYEGNTGDIIIERFSDLDPVAVPGVLVAGHAPFTWGPTATRAVENSIALEAVAEMVLGTWKLNPDADLPSYILDKHYQRKHGPGAYYGQR